MKLDLKEPILNYDGKPYQPSGFDKPMTLKDVFQTALTGVINGENLTAEKKNAIYQLSMKLYRKKEINFTAEELTLLKERVNTIYVTPLICGQVADIIDGREQLINENTDEEVKPEASTEPAKEAQTPAS